MKFLIIYVFIFVFSFDALACSCDYRKITQEDYDKFLLIFRGEIIEVEACNETGYQKFTFKVGKLFKGQTTRFIQGYNHCGGSCNYLYTKNQEWLIYSNPEYGLINDQNACGNSIAIRIEEKRLIGSPYYISEKEWKHELDFLNQRLTSESKIVMFQLKKWIPSIQRVLRYALFIVPFILLLFFCYKFKNIFFPSSIIFGLLGGYIWHLAGGFGQFLGNFATPVLLTLFFGILALSNIFHIRIIRSELNFQKSFILNYLAYILMVIVGVYLTKTESTQNLVFNNTFYFSCLIALSIGIPLSAFTALFFDKKIKVRFIKMIKKFLQKI